LIVSIPLSKGGIPEHTIIDLQGTLTSPTKHCLDGLNLGNLTIDSDTGKATLIIGNQQLEGKVETLARPLIVTQRFAEKNADGSYYLPVTAYIRKRVIFKDRPLPISTISSSIRGDD